MNLERRRMEFAELFILHIFLYNHSLFFSYYRLANLLRDDEQRYVAEFEAMKDTPEKQRDFEKQLCYQVEKTRRRCLELKQKREMEDRAISAAIMDRKFQFAFHCRNYASKRFTLTIILFLSFRSHYLETRVMKFVP